MGNLIDIQFYTLLGTVLAGIILQRIDRTDINGRLDRIGDELNRQIDSMRGQ